MTDAVWLTGIRLPEKSTSMIHSRSRDLTIAVGFLILGISCNQGKLLTISRLKHTAKSLMETTCISENGYGALVWNFREDDGEKLRKVSDFVPRKPKSTRSNLNCAIWENDRCFANWITITNHLVSSLDEPMGPVLDYRWESFKVNRSRSNMTFTFGRYPYFSVWNYEAVLITNCGTNKKCSVIILGRSLDKTHAIDCGRLTFGRYPICHREDSVIPLREFQKDRNDDMFGIEEWRTFGINLSGQQRRVRITEGDKVRTFITIPDGISDWRSYEMIVIGNRSQIKFHDYDYILLEKKDELLSTSDFYLRSEYFCIELFVGLCSDCQLVVTLQSDIETIPISSIDGNNDSTIDGLLVWRSVRLDAEIPVQSSKLRRLKLKTQLKNANATGRWAVDSLRRCELDGRSRKSTVTSSDEAGKYFCQKLSYDESIVVRSYPNKTLGVTPVNASGILDYSRGLDDISGSLCPNVGPACLICNPTGCTCDRRFQGLECDGENPKDNGISKGQNMIWLTVPLAIPIGILLVVIGYRVRLKNPRSPSETAANVPAESVDRDGYFVPSAASNRRNWIFPAMMNLDDGSLYQDIGFDGPPYDPRNHIVEISQFEHYLEDGVASGLLKSQYKHVSDDPPKACEYGKLLPNLAKNRSRNMIAYDETRVSLEKIAEDSYSDYINANYIRGYRQVPAYIATQGPTSNTIGDFWRMVWQEKTTLICMVTNLNEDGEVLCEQYWPEVQKSSKYEFIVVLNAEEVEFDDCVLRTFHVRCGNETREVTHLHYTGSWPSKGVLTYPSSLVAYLKNLLALTSGEGLVVVHGSLGVGRTGVIILCDICLRRALHDKVINVPETTIKMREDRGNIVENEHYYLLAHVLLSGCLLSEETQAADYIEILY